jgi:putative ABC transport system permease protein
MLFNYFKIALRNLAKHSVYSFINITGLSVGIASAILIMLWVADEIGYNRFHTNYERLYQVHMNREVSDGISTQNSLPYALKEAIKARSSRIRHIVMTNWGEGNLLAVGDKRLNKVGMCVGEDFLKMFTFPLLKGNANTALTDPASIVLSEETAKALFGDADPVGQLVKIDNDRSQVVTGVFADPIQSTFDFDYLMPFAFYEATQEWVRRSHDSWDNNSFQMFVELEQNASAEEVQASIKDLIRDNVKTEPKAEVILQPMKNWRLYSNFENGKVAGGLIEYVRMFSIIAIFVLVIACINFMNLATARSESRAREVGIRKSVGSNRWNLILQFLGESLLISLVAFLVALFIVELLLPAYSTLVNKKLSIDFLNPTLWLGALTIVLVTGIVAGSYPAFYLSAFQPSKVLKGKVQAGRGASLPRKVLVTIQFGFSILLIVGTIVIYQQIQHVKDREVGYDRENLLEIWTNTEIETNFQTIKDELLRTGAVKGVCKSNSPITRIFASNTAEWPGMPPGARVDFVTIATEYDYTETMGIKILEGRDFSKEFKSDSNAILVNKAAVDMMGLQNPVGEKIKLWGSEKPIVGVMDNVVMGAPDQPVRPLIMVFDPDWSSTITVRLEKTTNLNESVSKVEDVFKKLNPANPLWYRFADTEFETKFNSINLTSKLAGIFASLTIFITCMGLFGLAAFTAEQRTKEIGIRKVMGATVKSLVMLIAKDFSRLVLIAFIVAGPLSWWALNSFLERYPYRIPIYWWVLPAVGFFALLLAVIIVSTQAFKAAISNPSSSLRSE